MRALLVIFLTFSGALCANIFPYRLSVEYLQNPPAVNGPHPRLSWKIRGRLVQNEIPNNLTQTAYQIVAASDSSLLPDKADLWDTGKVVSNSQIYIKYEGQLPAPGKRIYWSVRLWDKFDNATPFASTSFWGTEYNVSQWTAHWISAPASVQQNGLVNISVQDSAAISAHRGLKPAMYLRKTFSLPSDVKEAKVYATAKGSFLFSL